jgi:hypothetical protein
VELKKYARTTWQQQSDRQRILREQKNAEAGGMIEVSSKLAAATPDNLDDEEYTLPDAVFKDLRRLMRESPDVGHALVSRLAAGQADPDSLFHYFYSQVTILQLSFSLHETIKHWYSPIYSFPIGNW